MHVDGRFFESDDPEGLKDTWQATRVRPIVEGTLGGIYDFRFTPDFGQGRTVIQDAYVTGRFEPAFQVTAGKFKSPVGLERLQSASDIRFVARGFPTQLAPNRDIGLQVAGGFARRSAELPGRLPERLERRRQQRDVRRRRPERRQGVRGARLRAPVRRKRELRAARTRPRHRRHLHVADGHDRAAAAARLPHAGTVDVLPLPHRHDARRSPTANARASRRSSTTTSAASACSASTPRCRRTSRARHDCRTARRTRWTRRPGRSRPPGS